MFTDMLLLHQYYKKAGTKQSTVEQLKISGYMGSRIDACITHRVKTQDVDHLVKPFTSRNESRLWQSEFWGKWIQGAIASYRYTKDPELLQLSKRQ